MSRAESRVCLTQHYCYTQNMCANVSKIHYSTQIAEHNESKSTYPNPPLHYL